MAATLPSTIKVRENVPFRDFTTFRIGGPARFFCEVSSEAELAEAVAWAKGNVAADGNGGLPIFILGGGSNILVADEGFAGLVILMNIKGLDFANVDDASNFLQVTVGAGENWDGFVAECVSRGLYGLENLSGIPGTVGAAPVQNIGAYGVEVAQVISSVRVYDTQENSWKNFTAAECGFEYRDSVFKKTKGRYVIVSATFTLQKSGSINIGYKDLQEYGSLSAQHSTPADVRAAVLLIRAKKLPDVREVGTAGSFFKNPIISAAHFADLKSRYPDMPSFAAGIPVNGAGDGAVKIPLAWILDHVCGYKGVTEGAVGTYKNQALVIVNNGTATAADIRKFAGEIAAAVKDKTGISIEPEVQYV